MSSVLNWETERPYQMQLIDIEIKPKKIDKLEFIETKLGLIREELEYTESSQYSDGDDGEYIYGFSGGKGDIRQDVDYEESLFYRITKGGYVDVTFDPTNPWELLLAIREAGIKVSNHILISLNAEIETRGTGMR